MAFFHQILSADYPAVGRPDKASFSDQTLMELFLGETEERKWLQDSDDNFIPIQRWRYLTVDSASHVTKIEISNFSKNALFRLEWLPETLHVLSISSNGCNQKVDWKVLPDGLHVLDIQTNLLFGSLPLQDLPSALWAFSARHNKLSGTLDFSQLPKELEYIDLGHNAFTGRVNLVTIARKLQKSKVSRLYTFYHTDTKFEGEVILDVILDHNSFDPDFYVYDIEMCAENISIPDGTRLIDRNGNERIHVES